MFVHYLLQCARNFPTQRSSTARKAFLVPEAWGPIIPLLHPFTAQFLQPKIEQDISRAASPQHLRREELHFRPAI